MLTNEVVGETSNKAGGNMTCQSPRGRKAGNRIHTTLMNNIKKTGTKDIAYNHGMKLHDIPPHIISQ
jgi:hypothetical protein